MYGLSACKTSANTKGILSEKISWHNYLQSIKKDSLKHIITLLNQTPFTVYREKYQDTLFYQSYHSDTFNCYYLQDAADHAEMLKDSIIKDTTFNFLRRIRYREFYLSINGKDTQLGITDSLEGGPKLLNEINLFSFKNKEYLLVNFCDGLFLRNIYYSLYLYQKQKESYVFMGKIPTLFRYYNIQCWGDFNGDNYLDFMTLAEKLPPNTADMLLYSENKLAKPYIYISNVKVESDSFKPDVFLLKK